MEKDVRFEIVLVGPQLRGESSGIPEIYVQVITGDKAPFYMREKNFMNRAQEIGHLDVKIWPACSKQKIIGSELTVHVDIKSAKGLPGSVDSTFVKYSLLGSNELRTKIKSGLNPLFQSNLSVDLGVITEESYKKLETEPLCFEICSSHKRHFIKSRPPQTQARPSQKIRDIEKLIAKSNSEGITNLSISDLSMILNIPLPPPTKASKAPEKPKEDKKEEILEPPIQPPRTDTPSSTSSQTCIIL
ncbi:Oidioi.mRNA.OKI2018_I69.chr2.g4948.t1.cds [Oikopleura dioica]|uniref:Oidioi.mRNA.OKI2018_I69.chr2.g4948.t1.cds n=1 Tax=Oikopleura dioica TaxID=34765 RepID=A0ABN7T4H9_OIKDI|nr:Oidioi.mRNA.OKI2018_I69.chr2.g4948.t1.cds [Oikopleura dioica]